MKKGKYINDSLHKLVEVTDYEMKIIQHVIFNRLHDVYQNSTAYMTFPSNRTKRFEHSIGTMKLASDMFLASIMNSSETTLKKFYDIFYLDIKKLIIEINSNETYRNFVLGKKGIPKCEIPSSILKKEHFFLIPSNIKDEYKSIHYILIQSIRIVALLHDIGHPPFSHVIENTLRKVFLDLKEKKEKGINLSNVQKEYFTILKNFFSDDKQLHEEIGKKISKSILMQILQTYNDEEEKSIYLIILECVMKILCNSDNFKFLHELIDSSIDADRLDYVSRDPINSGMGWGMIDYGRIINDMQIHIEQNNIYFCFSVKSINSLEDFLRRRFRLYKDILYHHRVVKTDFLLGHIIEELIYKYFEDNKNSESNAESKTIPIDVSGLWHPLLQIGNENLSDSISQWNDSWLMTMLKNSYFTQYYNNAAADKSILSSQLNELLQNKKSYYSLIKRNSEFKLLDDAVKEKFKVDQKKIFNLYESIKKISENIVVNEENRNSYIDMGPSWKAIESIYNDLNSSDFILYNLYVKSKPFFSNYDEIVNSAIKDALNKNENIEVYDIIVVFKKISTGLKDQAILFDNDENTSNAVLKNITDLSPINDCLQLELKYYPLFYIYILVKDANSLELQRNDILRLIGEKIGERMTELIYSRLNNIYKSMESEEKKICVI